MKKIVSILIAMFALTFNAFSQNTTLPFFGRISNLNLCGKPGCQSTTSPLFATVKNLDYSGTPSEYLGTPFDNFFERELCSGSIPSESDLETINSNTISATVEAKSKVEFELKVNANLAQLIRNFFPALPDNIKADLIAQLGNTIKNESSKQMEIEYKVVQLKFGYISKEVAACLKSATKRKISTGISVVTVKGNWTSNVLKETLDKFEANASVFEQLSASAKIEFQKSKETILKGNFNPISIVTTVTYRQK